MSSESYCVSKLIHVKVTCACTGHTHACIHTHLQFGWHTHDWCYAFQFVQRRRGSKNMSYEGWMFKRGMSALSKIGHKFQNNSLECWREIFKGFHGNFNLCTKFNCRIYNLCHGSLLYVGTSISMETLVFTPRSPTPTPLGCYPGTCNWTLQF